VASLSSARSLASFLLILPDVRCISLEFGS
jgi:hypothetical protein